MASFPYAARRAAGRCAPAGAAERGWDFAVARSRSGRELHDFYAAQLAASGWACVKDSAAGLPADDAVYAAPQSFAASKDTRGLVVAYRGDTGEVSVVVDDFHAALGPLLIGRRGVERRSRAGGYVPARGGRGWRRRS